MAEYTNSAIVTVAAGANVPLTETAVSGSQCITHREGAGIITLRGITDQCRARFRVSFGGNIAIPAEGTVEAIAAALALNGEALASATATVTPAATGNYFNVFVSAIIDVPKGCCASVAMKNTGTQPILVANSNMTVDRIC